MPPRANGKEKASALQGDEEEIRQAVILADSFNKRFTPLTITKPRCLLPVCNAPLLEWTFESLALAGVQEIFVVCRSHTEQIKRAIRESKWSRSGSGIKIVPIITAREVFSAGDAMRDIYTHGIITTDFILVSGDLVSNIRIDEIVKVHKERRKVNKDAIMTMVVKEAGSVHPTRPRGETSIFVLDSNTSECLHYESVAGYPPKTHSRIPREIFNEHPDLDIRNDLIDCYIDICSVEVPSLFQDNFDYQDIRRDFVHGVLTSDLLMKNIYCHVVTDGYAARAKDTKSYAAITKDILSRWTFPLVPDNDYPDTSSSVSSSNAGPNGYEHQRGNIYLSLAHPPSLARTSVIGPLTLLGPRTLVAPEAHVSHSVVGANCSIGAGAVVRGCVLMNSVVVEGGTLLEGCIVGEGVRVREGSRIGKGCLVGDGVIFGPAARLPPFTRVSRRKVDMKRRKDEGEEEDDEELVDVEEAQTPEFKSWLGAGSNGMVWPDQPQNEGDDEEDEINARQNQRLLRLGDNGSDLDLSDIGSITSESESEDEDSDRPSYRPSHSRNSSLTSLSHSISPSSRAPLSTAPFRTSAKGRKPHRSSSHNPAASSSSEAEFRAEVQASLARAFAENHSVDNAAVELKTLRMASNVPLRHVREAVIGAVVDRINVVDPPIKQRAEIAKVVERWGELILKIGGSDGVETVELLQEHCAHSSTSANLFGQILASLYQNDIVEEEDIRGWHKLPTSRMTGSTPSAEGMNRLWAVGSRMIQSFDEQEEEDDSDSE